MRKFTLYNANDHICVVSSDNTELLYCDHDLNALLRVTYESAQRHVQTCVVSNAKHLYSEHNLFISTHKTVRKARKSDKFLKFINA
jgi:hypothetical protein